MKIVIIALPLILLVACGHSPEQASDQAIANQAESLERAANATTDQLIGKIEAESAAQQTEASANAASGNTSEAQ